MYNRHRLLAATLFLFAFFPATAQTGPRKDIVSLDKLLGSKPIPVSRWVLSFNPYGLLEPPAAIGLGVGYRLTGRVELWSETSFLTNGFFVTEGPVTGVREILQAKYFIDQHMNFFIAAEVRYKTFQYRDKEDFYNSVTHDSLSGFSSFGRHYFMGVGMQVGWRTKLTRNGKFQIELTAGVGVRNSNVERKDVPQGYHYTNFDPPKDLTVVDMANDFAPVYFPGSMRIICLFGKRLRP